eukprot:PhM_4_TR18945/c0_g1_i1/m.59758/K01230/MAN1; mannosyl-oligosaccharide alpha-1,2-mannosidase
MFSVRPPRRSAVASRRSPFFLVLCVAMTFIIVFQLGAYRAVGSWRHGAVETLPSSSNDDGVAPLLKSPENVVVHSTSVMTPVVATQPAASTQTQMASSKPKGRSKLYGFPDPSHFTPRQRAVLDAFNYSYQAYRKHAWGHDEYMPFQQHGRFHDWAEGGLALTAIESMDTMYLMGMRNEFLEVVDFLSNPKHTFKRHSESSVFETTIRVLGGLLSAYELTERRHPVLLRKAVEFADLLMPAFNTGSDIPHASVNLETGEHWNPPWLGAMQSLSEVTTLQLEFRTLSRLSNDPKYDIAVTKVMKKVLRNAPDDGLMGLFIMLDTGASTHDKVTFGARGDSYYEYIVKQWVLTGRTESVYLDAYNRFLQGIYDKLLVEVPGKDEAFLVELVGEGKDLKMDHLVCFVPGMLMLGLHGTEKEKDRQREVAAKITNTCYQMYAQQPTGLSPEIVRFQSAPTYTMYVSPGASHYIMRPEATEAMFYMWRYTSEEKWRDYAWKMFTAMDKHMRLPDGLGFAGLRDVTNVGAGHTDKMESFWLAETLKYQFLIYADDDGGVSLDDWVFNTEAHPLPIYTPTTTTGDVLRQ